MCRYARPYKLHFACFGCRKMFRQPSWWELAAPRQASAAERVVPCPQCGERMHDLGLDFKAPRQRDREQREKVRRLHAQGIRFNSCGCSGSWSWRHRCIAPGAGGPDAARERIR